MKRLLKHLRARPRLLGTFALGAVVALLLPARIAGVTRALAGWNVAVWLYLVLALAQMWRSDHRHLRRLAGVHAEGAAVVTTAAASAAAASLASIVIELSAARGQGPLALGHVVFGVLTLAGSWLLLPTLFAQTYASLFYRDAEPRGPGRGLTFPGGDDLTHDHGDFLYFAVTIAATAQTSDVGVTTSEMRRWVMAQTLLSFAFNTALLALAINIAAGLL